MSKTWKRNDGLKKFKSPKTKGRQNKTPTDPLHALAPMGCAKTGCPIDESQHRR